MWLKRLAALAAILIAECAAFAVALLVFFRALGDVVNSWWLGLVILGALYFLVGAVPIPSVRAPLFIGIAAFLVPLLILGWIAWQIQYFLIFEHVGAWENLPCVMLDPENLGSAGLLCICAIAGHVLSRRMFTRAWQRQGLRTTRPG